MNAYPLANSTQALISKKGIRITIATMESTMYITFILF